MTTYRLILEGSILPGNNRKSVIDNAARLFHIDSKKAEALVSGKPRTVKENMDKNTAHRYMTSVTGAGLKCRLESDDTQKETEPVLQLESAVTPPPPCPKCGRQFDASFNGNPPAECPSCGVVMNKFKGVQPPARKKRPDRAKPAPPAEADEAVVHIVVKPDHTKRRILTSLFILAIVCGITAFFLKEPPPPAPPDGVGDIKFGTPFFEFSDRAEFDIENPNLTFGDMVRDENRMEFEKLMIASYATQLGPSSPLYNYDIFSLPTSEEKTYLGYRLWKIYIGCINGKLVYIRIYPLEDEGKNAKEDLGSMMTRLRERFGLPHEPLIMPYYPTILTLASQWYWEEEGIAIRTVAPIVSKAPSFEYMGKQITFAELQEEFTRPFIEFFSAESDVAFFIQLALKVDDSEEKGQEP